MKKRQLNFLLSILSEYAKESGQSIRSKNDLSPLETWLIKKLYENCFYVSDNNFKTKLIKAINKIVKYVLLKLSRVFKKLKKYMKPKFYGYKSPDDVIERLIEKCDYPEDFAINKTRKREYVQSRQIAQIISRYLFPEKSLAEIGSYFVNSDHATVLHSIKTVKNLCETDKKYLKNFNDVQKKILGFVYIKF